MTESARFSVFVTGTDTGVGKTLVSTALLHTLARHYPRVVGMKPVAAGTEMYGGVQANDDVLALRAASNLRVEPELDNPYLLAAPVSPHIAAERAGVRIDIRHIAACHHALMQLADAVVVEGAGGFMVPLLDDGAESIGGGNLAVALKLPVLLVVGLRLGCLNHALLTAEAIRSRGLTLGGWIANQVDPDMAEKDKNISFLERRLDAPQLANIPWQPGLDTSKLTMELPAAWLPNGP